MFKKNALILFFVTILTLLLSGFLFYEGFKAQPFEIKNLTDIIDQPKESPSKFYDIATESEVSTETAILNSSSENGLVTKVIDGDTVEININGVLKKLRYVGIDTPETVDPRRPKGCFGAEASKENKRLVEGKIVTLEKDITDYDKYDRMLRYVYLKLDDGTTLFVNDYLVRQGYANVYTYPPDVKYNEQFVEAQKEARENNRGLWGKC